MSDRPADSSPRTESAASTHENSNLASADDNSLGLALTITEAAEDRKGEDILVLKVVGISYLADYFILITGFSRVQVRAISQAIEAKVSEVWQRQPLRVEGLSEGTWVLQDYGDAIVHILMPEEREFYNLEAFWGHAERIQLPSSVPETVAK